MVQSRGQKVEDINVSYSLDSHQFSLHEPLILNFVVKNSSDKSVQVNLGKNDTQNFLITIIRPDDEPSVPTANRATLTTIFVNNGSPNYIDETSHWHLRFGAAGSPAGD
jgi:hypothetical protein